jgi:hypothetical protein
MSRLACPQCKTVLTVAEEERGKIITCSGCDRKLRIPPGKPAAPAPRQEQAIKREMSLAAKRRPVQPPPDEEPEEEEGASPPAGGKKKKRKPKDSSGVTGVLGGIGGLVALAVFLLVISGKWVDLIWDPLQKALEAQGIHPLLAIGITFVIVMIPVGLYVLFTTKSNLLSAMPDELDFRPARPADFSELDDGKLRSYTDAFESLGFRRLKDYTTLTELDNGLTGFARLFFHPKQRCFAEVNQVLHAGGAAVPMRCMLLSYLDDGWSVSTSDRKATREFYLMRRPKAVWESRPGEDVEELFDAHLELRRRMVSDLDVEVLADGAAEAYFTHEQKNNEQRKQAVRRRTSVGILLDLWLFDRNPRREWLGQFRPKAGKAKKKG